MLYLYVEVVANKENDYAENETDTAYGKEHIAGDGGSRVLAQRRFMQPVSQTEKGQGNEENAPDEYRL